MRGPVLALLLTCAATPIAAQVGTALIREMAGPWQLIPTDGSPACTIALTATPAGREAWRAVSDAACRRRLPGVVAWRPVDGMELLDTAGQSRMTFVEDETALPSSPDLQHPRFYLVPRIAGFTHLPQPAEWVGSWVIASRRGRCTITLTANGRARATGCAKGTLPTRVDHWAIEGLNLNLWGPGDRMLLLSPAGDRRYRDATTDWTLTRRQETFRTGFPRFSHSSYK